MKNFCEPIATDHCPVTGLTILSRPEWTNVGFDKGYMGTASLLGDSILLLQGSGYAKLHGLKDSLSFTDNILAEVIPEDQGFVLLEDLSNVTGTSRDARKYFINYVKKHERLLSLIFYSASPVFKLSIKLGKRLNIVKFNVKIVDNYADAIKCAQKVLSESQDKSESKSLMPGYTKKHPDITSGKPDKIDQYVNELLQFIEKIDWEKNDIDQNRNIDPSHPFAPVFDAIALVKWELDDLIMQRTRTEEELKQAKETAESANIAKSEFLANMSHELRTPLNHILGFTELVVDKNFGDLNDIQEEYLNDVLSSSKHLLSLINDILDLSKVEAGKFELEPSNCNLKMLLENSLIMIKEKALKHGIRLSNHIDGIPEIIKVDERKLKQIMYNLLSNAVKFTQDGGEIRLTADLADSSLPIADSSMEKTSDQELRAISYELKASQKFVRISVTDNGIGIKHENLEHIFNPFEQVESSASRRFQGTGLGLSLTKSLVKLHGGKLWAESGGEGKGSTFRFIIPLKI